MKQKAKPYRGKERRMERRLFPRLPICARVLWGRAGGEERYYFTRDISNGGLFLLTDHPPPLLERLTIQLSIQYLKNPVELDAQVVRHEAAQGCAVGFGVKILKQNRTLNRLLEKLGKQMVVS